MLCGNVWDFTQEGMNKASRILIQVKQKEIIPPALWTSYRVPHCWMQWMMGGVLYPQDETVGKSVGLDALLTSKASLTPSLYLCC